MKLPKLFIALLVGLSQQSLAQFIPVTMWKNKIGYFVQTADAYPPNFGGLVGADSICLSDLQTYDWKGKSSAGPLHAGRVKAFLCDNTSCTNPLPNTTYIFATSGFPLYGGATFTTDASGRGPNNTMNWNATNHFGDAWLYWTGNRDNTLASLWGVTPKAASDSCNNWTSVTFGTNGLAGDPTSTNGSRWNDNGPADCSLNSFALICLVHPE